MSGRSPFDLSLYKVIYLCAGPDAWGLSLDSTPSFERHRIATKNGINILYPESLDPVHVNPESITNVLKRIRDNKWLIIDRIKTPPEILVVRDHVNKSGENWLRGKTPYGDHPQFPDMSHIYSVPEGLPAAVVHTVGPRRFRKSGESTENISEAAGLVAPVLHYVGIRVSAVGGKRITPLLKQVDPQKQEKR